ncbi:MAG: adenylosuccinate lyase [Chloroflexi bacterium]|nr:adenylosuccinate lyase [Chloroflexota bacterium]
MTDVDILYALTSLDGRYSDIVSPLREYLSEFSFLRARLCLEIDYLIALSKTARLVRPFTPSESALLASLAAQFSTSDAIAIKEIERTTRHDVKAIEYFLRARLESTSLADTVEWIHFGLTSEDVGQTAFALALRDSRDAVLLPALDEIARRLARLAVKHKATPMLGRTHGQPAVPTTLGKELAVTLIRLQKARARIAAHRFEGKLTGAVGNLNALAAAAPRVDWLAFADDFIRTHDLEPNRFTTQLMPYDNWLQYFADVHLVNAVLIGFCQDIWQLISRDYLTSKAAPGQVGSSTMPQKVNPIDFENAEGNLGVANSLLAHYADKLAISRLQRDLSDSTVRRTFGSALGHTLVAYVNIAGGLDRVSANEATMSADLDAHWETIAEGIQTVLRAAGMPRGYETLKALTQGKHLSEPDLKSWIDTLDAEDSVKDRLRALTPRTYTGLAEQLVDLAIQEYGPAGASRAA